MTTTLVDEPLDRSRRSTRRGLRDSLRVLAAQVTTDVRANLRVPEFLVGAVSLPILLYAMFGSAEAGDFLAGGTHVAAMMAVSFAAYGIVSLAIFTFGVDIAQERGKGWLRARLVTPLPTWVYFVGKLAMALVYAVFILAGITLTAVTLGDVSLPMITWVRIWLVALTGAVTFSTLGFALAFLARPRAASAIGNLVFLPLSFASGFFIPLSDLPPFFGSIAPWLPTYHYGRVLWAQLGSSSDVAAWVGVETSGSLMPHVGWMVGSFVVFGVLAVVGFRHDRETTLG